VPKLVQFNVRFCREDAFVACQLLSIFDINLLYVYSQGSSASNEYGLNSFVYPLDAVVVIPLKMLQCYWRSSGYLITRFMVWPMDFLWVIEKMFGSKHNPSLMKLN